MDGAFIAEVRKLGQPPKHLRAVISSSMMRFLSMRSKLNRSCGTTSTFMCRGAFSSNSPFTMRSSSLTRVANDSSVGTAPFSSFFFS